MQWEAWLDHARAAGMAVWAVLSSPLAQRLYVLSACLLCFAGAILAWRVQAEIRDIADGKNLEPPSTRGRPVKLKATLEKKLAQLDAVERDFLGRLVNQAALVIAFGHLLPTLGLFVFAWAYGWLSMGGAMLVGPTGPVASPSLRETALFCLTQLAGGSLADTLEVFGISWTSLRVDPSAKHLLALLVVYRLVVGAFAAILLLSIQAMLLLRQNLAPRRKEIEEKLQALAAAA